jgi:NDP-sugar pyrophosphorylase family protein
MMRKWEYILRGTIKQDEQHRYVPQKVGEPLPARKLLKSVVLVAGKGTRLRPLTDTVPKPLLPLHGHPILEYILDGIILSGVTQIALIVGYLEEMIRNWVKNDFLKKTRDAPWRISVQIDFIHQEKVNGTGGAVLLAKSWAGSTHCFVTYGDILMSWSAYADMVDLFQKNHLDWYLVGNPTEDPSMGAAIYYDQNWITDFIEKPPKTAPFTNLNNAGCYIFPPMIFDLLKKTPLSPRGEIELTAPIIDRIHNKQSPYLVKLGREEFWCDVGTVPVYEKLQKSTEWVDKVKNLRVEKK